MRSTETRDFIRAKLGYRPGDVLPSRRPASPPAFLGQGGPSPLGHLAEGVISALAVGQIHGLINPSYAEIKRRAREGGAAAVKETSEGLLYSALLEAGASGVVGLAFGSWIPAVVGTAFAAVLYGVGRHAVAQGVAEHEGAVVPMREY